EEFKRMQSHVTIGAEILAPVPFPWPVLPIVLTHVDPSSSSSGFYRLQIEQKDAAGEPVGLPSTAVPGAISGYAQDHLDSLKLAEPDWNGAVLGPVVVPLYHPAVNEGKGPAFYEFKVIGKVGRSLSQVDPRPERGFILVSSGPHSPPIPEYATEGATPSEKLRFLANSSAVHIVRYGATYWAAEDEKGQLVASLGPRPYRMPEGILDFIGQEPTTEILDGKVVVEGVRPALEVKAYATYAEFKQDVVSGPLQTVLRRFASQRAAVDWNLRQDKAPELISVPLQQTVVVLNTKPIASADVEDPIASVTPDPKTGLNVTGLQPGATLLMVMDADRQWQFYVLAVGSQGLGRPKGWSSWSSTYAGGCADIPAYDQEEDLAGCCVGGWSGCGPTCWAMFYGYWDNRGVTGLIGGAGATPWSNDDDVRACIHSVFDYTGTWCTGIDGNAATNPWDMADGYQWAPARGEHIDLSASWTVPSTSSGPRNRAKASICDDSRPAIVGTGFYAHYPFAYGYRHREYTVWGVTWKTERQWKVAMGWGGSSCSWVNANDCWYGTRARCF
ncbi:MAG TPA: hypothetical protein VJA21_16045, partial [Verrucomicrobiae bacterium]